MANASVGKKKQEHESVIIYSVIYFFFDVFVTNIIHYHKKIKCKILPRPGIEPVTSEPGSETKAAMWLERGPLFRPILLIFNTKQWKG